MDLNELRFVIAFRWDGKLGCANWVKWLRWKKVECVAMISVVARYIELDLKMINQCVVIIGWKIAQMDNWR